MKADNEKNIEKNRAVENAVRPAPDNKGLLKQKPKHVSEAAAESNRDIDGLEKQFPDAETAGNKNK